MARLRTFFLRNKLLGVVLLLWCLVQTILLFIYPQHSRNMKVLSWDSFGYYLYLPATFIYHDLFHLNFVGHIMEKYQPSAYFYAARIGPSGNYVMNYSLGTALLYFPFFCFGHILALVFHYEPDGFSAPYQYSVFFGGLFYSLLGIVVTMRNLRFFLSEKVTALLLLILLAGTNYFYYTAIENAMTHNYLFTVGACIIYLSIKWHQKQKMAYALLLGLFIGLAIIIRPTEILWCLIPLLWSIKNWDSLKQKLAIVSQNFGQLAGLVFCVFLIGLVQMLYWKAASGKFIYYSYDGFFEFNNPHIQLGLFSLKKGWLVYTPVMALALAGIPVLWFKNREVFWAILIYTVAVIYITFSWHAWWYGGSFGSRPMVETYALLLLPMGSFLTIIFRVTILKYALLALIAFCIFLNCFQTWQFVNGIISSEGPTDYVYKLNFLKTHQSREMIRDYFDLEKPVLPIKDSLPVYSSLILQSDSVAPLIKTWVVSNDSGQVVFNAKLACKKYNYMRVSGRAMFEPFQGDANNFSYLRIALKHTDNQVLKTSKLPLQPLVGNANISWERDLMGVPGVWDDVYTYVHLPEKDSLQVEVSIHNPSGNNLNFNNLQVLLLNDSSK